LGLEKYSQEVLVVFIVTWFVLGGFLFLTRRSIKFLKFRKRIHLVTMIIIPMLMFLVIYTSRPKWNENYEIVIALVVPGLVFLMNFLNSGFCEKCGKQFMIRRKMNNSICPECGQNGA